MILTESNDILGDKSCFALQYIFVKVLEKHNPMYENEWQS